MANFKEVAFRKNRKIGLTPANSTKISRQTDGEGLILIPKTESPDPVPQYIVSQQVCNMKCQAISSTTALMRQKLEQMRRKIQATQSSMAELVPFTASSNLILTSAAVSQQDSLYLCIYNPSLHQRRKNRDDYLLPVKGFADKIKEKTNNKQVYLDVVVNFGGVRRVVIPTTLLTRPTLGETDVKSLLVNLTEIKIFQKLRTVTNRSDPDLRCEPGQEHLQRVQLAGLHEHPCVLHGPNSGEPRVPPSRRYTVQVVSNTVCLNRGMSMSTSLSSVSRLRWSTD